ncbi:MAG: hypothetical protein KAS38_03340 [Anaerolineales bacterium]|jgi:hypothetical protein|nr:hypothetical protein [Anaerolineales bacterium]
MMLVTIIMVFGLVILACAPAATEEPAAPGEPAPEEPAPKQPAEVEAGSVGIEMDNQSLFLF